jgi:hypothetical protein
MPRLDSAYPIVERRAIEIGSVLSVFTDDYCDATSFLRAQRKLTAARKSAASDAAKVQTSRRH